jgi:hypothetical protein
MYKGQVGPGLAWLFGVVVAYLSLAPLGLILHIICVVAAASGSQVPQSQAAEAAEVARLEQESAQVARIEAARQGHLNAERTPYSTRAKFVAVGLVVGALGVALWVAAVADKTRSNAPTTTTPQMSAGPRRPTSALTFTCAGSGSDTAEFIPGDSKHPVDNLQVTFTQRPTPTEAEAVLRQCIDAASTSIRIDYETLVNAWVGDDGPLPLIDGSRHLAYDPKTNKVQTLNEREAKAPATSRKPPTPERSEAPLSPPTPGASAAPGVQQWGPPPNQLKVNVTDRGDGWQIRNLNPGYTWQRCEAGIGASSAKLPALPPGSAVTINRSEFKPPISGAIRVFDVWVTCRIRGQTYMVTTSDDK